MLLTYNNMSIISSSGNLILSLKVAVISTCVLSVAVTLKLSVLPLISDFVASDVPSFWNVMLQWLKPPYLYLVINGIIISIVASSKLQHKDDHLPPEVSVAPEKVVAGDVRTGYALVYEDVGYLNNISTEENQGVYGPVEERKKADDERVEMKTIMDGGDEMDVVEKFVITPERSDSMEFLDSSEKEKDKYPISARFVHQKSVKASPEGGKALRVSKSNRRDTLDSTWKTITEGRAMPLSRHLKKSDTWDTHMRKSTPPPAPRMKKAETVDEQTTTSSSNSRANANSGRLKREPSLSQDELNRRVEAFIKNFNEEMRLQRQRSLEQYNQMIRGGAN